MSKLDELIKELCPDGVEWKKISDICNISRGIVISKDDIRNNIGEYPVYSSQTENNGELGKISTFAYDGEYLTWTTDGANAGTVFYRTGKFNVTNVCGLLKTSKSEYMTRYVFHVLRVEALKYVRNGMGNPKLMSNVMGDIQIPLPPLPVQREIVRILDNFTELTAELTAELTDRKKQYKYYRDKLLAFDGKKVEWKKLEDISIDMYRGAGIKRDQVTEEGIPCVRYGEIYTSYDINFKECISHINEKEIQSRKYFEYGDILFAITGESIEDIAKSIAYLGNDRCMAGGDVVVMRHNQNPRYLSYALSTTNAQMQKSRGKVKSKVVHSSVPALKEIIVPIPSPEEQERIASILDNFHSFCNNILEGLPAEIDERQKQYEYYRDKLLAFPKAELEV